MHTPPEKMALGTQQLPHQQNQKNILTTQQRLFQQNRPIAPAPTSAAVGTSRFYMPYTKPGYMTVAGSTLDENNPSVVRRNARERNRVKQVNNGFVHLRQHIPQAIVADLSNGRRGGTGPGANKKLSKVNTLRMAVEYIRRLQRVIEEVDQSDTSSVSSYASCESAASLSGSPPPGDGSSRPQHFDGASLIHQQQQQQTHSMYALGFAGSFQQQQQQHQQMISPAASSCSDASSSGSVSASYYNHLGSQITSTPLKYEPTTYEEYPNTSTEDEELLDYISLWQEDM